MAVVSTEEVFLGGRNGGMDDKGVRHATRFFKVLTNSTTDDQYIVTGLTSGIPSMYAPYVSISSSDPGCIVKKIDAKQREDQPLVWDVTVSYDSSPLKSMASPSDSNDNRQVPDSRPWTYSFSSNKSTRILQRDWSGFNGGTIKDVVNSAGIPFDPPLEVPSSNPVIKITAYKASFSYTQITTFQDAINDATWQGFPAKTVRCTDYAATSHYDNGVFCFQLDVQVEIKWDQWNPVKVLDAGTVELIQPTLAGPKYYKQIVDAHGQPIHKPVPLDGSGKKLAVGGTPVYLSFDGFIQQSFASII